MTDGVCVCVCVLPRRVESPIGHLPSPGSLDTKGLNLKEDALAELFKINKGEWLQEVQRTKEFHSTFGERLPAGMKTQLAENPHIKWFHNRRGYITCSVDEQQWLSEYRTVAYVTKPGAPLETAARFRLEHGKPGLQKL